MSHISFLYHIIWRTKYSERTIFEEHERNLYAYINGICKQKGCKLHRINSMPDHIHMLVTIRPDLAVSEFVKIIKGESSKWIKEHQDLFPRFRGWGTGYAGFTYAEKDKEKVRQYIIQQKEHHHHKSFEDELLSIMQEFGVGEEAQEVSKNME